MLLLFIYFGLVFGLSMWFPAWIGSFSIIPIVWTSIEFLRSLSPEIGFPWGSIGYVLIPYLQLVQLAEFVGLPGITFFILIINLLLFYAIKKRELKHLFLAFVLIGFVWVQGYVVLKNLEKDLSSAPTIRVGVIQPNVSPEIKQAGEFDYRLSLLYKLSRGVGNCDLIVWPESAIPGYFNFENTQSEVERIVNLLNIPVIIGSSRLDLSIEPTRIYNSSFLVFPKYGTVSSYDKIYLVPFGERLPFSEIFPALQKLDFGQGNFSQGKAYKVFELTPPICHSERSEESRPYKFSCLICFESIFSRISRRFVNNGAQFLVNITDDCWFGRTPGPYQHAQQAVLRAIEYRIPLVRCGNTGISYFVDKRGEVKLATEIFTQRVIIKDIQLRDRLTFYAKWGDWFAWLWVGIFFIAFNLRLIRPQKKS